MANENLPVKKEASFKALLKDETIKNRFYEVLDKKAAGFMSALLNIYNSNKQLQECDAWSILGAAGFAATLNLSITPSLGQAYVVPYRAKDGSYQATFQIGAKGLIQMAHRTGKYAAIHAGAVREGEIRGFNPITGEPITGDKISDEIVGYVAYMRLINGFEKTLYMTISEIEAHAQRHSKAYAYDKRNKKESSLWSTDFDIMATKTVLKKLLRSWGVLSADMTNALQGDQSVVDKNSFTYVDRGGDVQFRNEIYSPDDSTTINVESGEIIQQETKSGENQNDQR